MGKPLPDNQVEGHDRVPAWRRAMRWAVLAGVLAGLLFLGISSLRPDDPPTPGDTAVLVDPSMGSEAAQVTIIEYGDFG